METPINKQDKDTQEATQALLELSQDPGNTSSSATTKSSGRRRHKKDPSKWKHRTDLPCKCQKCTGHASGTAKDSSQDSTAPSPESTTTPNHPIRKPVSEAGNSNGQPGKDSKTPQQPDATPSLSRRSFAIHRRSRSAPSKPTPDRGTSHRRTSSGSPKTKKADDPTLKQRREAERIQELKETHERIEKRNEGILNMYADQPRIPFNDKIWRGISQPGVKKMRPRPADSFESRLWSGISKRTWYEPRVVVPLTPPAPTYSEYLDELIGKIEVDESLVETDPELYERKLTLLRLKLINKLKQHFQLPYSNAIASLLKYVRFASYQLKFITERSQPFHRDEYTYPSQPVQTNHLRATPYCEGEFRQGPPQKPKVSQRVPVLLRAVIDGYEGMYCNTIIGNGRVTNVHLHTSILKRYASTLIKQHKLDAYSMTGQNWLSNTVNGGNCVYTGAFVNKVLETEWPRIAKTKIPVLAVVQHYTPGVHIGNEYSYICNSKGQVLGTSNEGSHDFWTDMNIDLPYSGDWHGMNVTTLMEIGPQRLVWIAHDDPTMPVFKPHSRVDNTFECKDINDITMTYSHCQVGFDLEEKDPENDYHRIVGFDPFLVYRTYNDTVNVPLKERARRYIERLWHNTRCYQYMTDFKKFLGINTPEYQITLCPNLCQFPIDDDMLYQLYYSNPIDPITRLPYGYYKITEHSIQQLHDGDNSANWTNVWSLFSAYAMRKRHSDRSVYNELVDKTCRLHPFLKPESGNNAFQPPFESPLQPIMARRPYKVEIFEKPGMSVKLFDEEDLREYVVNYVTRKSVSAAASWRVVRAGLRNIMPMGVLLHEYEVFWEHAVCGGVWCGIPDTDDIPNIDHFKGKKRRKYAFLLDNLGTSFMRSHYKLFCKMEALPLSNVLKKAVRIISPNNPVFNLICLEFFINFEEKLLSARSWLDTPYFAKGLNYEQRFHYIQVLAWHFNYCYSIDFKNFDAHHCDDNYRQEIYFYVLLGLRRKYGDQLLNGRHTGVITYDALMRCSGDLFTGSGNCLTVGALLYPFVSKDFLFFCDGDDTLLFLNRQSDYEFVRRHLCDRGYELGEPEIVRIARKASGVFEYAIPFCQVEYHFTYYCKDITRLLNKCGNLAGADLDAVAKACLGKLQSFSILKAHGVKFDIDISKYLVGLDEDYETDYKKMMIENLEHYEPYMERSISLKEGNSLIAQIARKFEYHKFRIFTTKISNRPKLLRRLIREVLETELHAETAQNPDEQALTKKVRKFVEREGFEAVVPVVTNIYREMVRSHTTWVILPPQTPTTSTTLLYANGQMYT